MDPSDLIVNLDSGENWQFFIRIIIELQDCDCDDYNNSLGFLRQLLYLPVN